jgi:CRISPR-associated protein Csm1
MNFNNEEKILILGALFHDIGKFRQRGDENNRFEKHQLLSSSFVNEIFEQKYPSLSNLVLNHHKEDLQKSNLKGKDKILAEILCEADNIASMERKPDRSITQQQPLESIFSKVDFGKELIPTKIFQPISEIAYSNYKFVEDNFNLDELNESYKKWWKRFEEEIKNVNIDEIETLIYVLKKYLWCVPSSSWRTRSDVSLFEHSRITAAIAISMFKYLMEKSEKIENIKTDDIQNKEEQKYLLMLADITGIQKYIYNISHKGASKALKGRSFYLQQMLDNIAYWILDKQFELPITNLIYSSGGKFYIFALNTEDVKKKIKIIQKELEQKFLEEYDGDLGVIIGSIPLSGEDLKYDESKKVHLISEKWDELNKIIEQNKKHKFSNNWDYDLFIPAGIYGDVERCAATGKELASKFKIQKTNSTTVQLVEDSPIKFKKYQVDGKIFYQVLDNEGNDTNDYLSAEQFLSQQIGTKSKRKSNTIAIYDIIAGYSVMDLNSFEILDTNEFGNKYNAQVVRHFLINDTELKKLKGNTEKGFKFYGGDWRMPDTYEDVIKNGVGIQRLGVLRLDVDNLGLIFKNGLGSKATFGRVVQLSSMLDFFFSHYLNKLKHFSWDPKEGLLEDYKKFDFKVRDLIEIVYSGGDDVFIVGHWSLLPDIAIWINEEFKKFTSENPNFSISAGISLFDDKYPIYKAALDAGELENKAKKKERKNRDGTETKKNGICFLDDNTPVSWSDFKQISKYVKMFYSWLEYGEENIEGEKKKISKGLISRLYSIYEEYKTGKFQNWAKWRWRASYSLARLGKQYKDPYVKRINEFAAELFTSNKTEQELVHLLFIIANWTDLLTRKKEN